MRGTKIISTLVMLCLSLTVVVAQLGCPALVSSAIETVASNCSTIGRNQICYGNAPLEVSLHETMRDSAFGQPGDLLNVNAVQRLDLSPMSLTDETWSVAVMNIHANLPSSTAANVTLLLFGELAIDNTGEAVQIEANIVAPNPVNVRSAPSTQGAIVNILDSGTIVTVNGRNTAGDWLHIQYDDGGEGWIAVYLIQTNADLNTLSLIDTEAVSYAPMQAFNLQTGIEDAPCAEAPNSGLLVQTPETTDNIQLQVNGVDIQLNGTAFFQAEAGNALFINLLEGIGTVSALDKVVIIPAGATSSVPLDDSLLVRDIPADPTPYNLETLQSLPLSLLPRQIEIIEPLTQRDVNRATACRIVSTIDGTNFRQGPGTAYFATGTLIANHPYQVNGRTNGRDGFVWWRVTAQQWVRADIVTTSGNCDAVAYTDDRPAQPSTTGYSTNLTCTSERVIYAEVGDSIPISDWYVSSAVPVGAIVAKLFVDGDVVYEGLGTASGTGIMWNTTWQATTGIHNVEVQYTMTIEVKPDWAERPFEPGESWSHKVCQIRVE